MGLHSILCRVLLFTSTAFNTDNEVSIEFATPEALPTSNVLLCANDTSVQWSSSFTPLSLDEGGSTFSTDEKRVFSAPEAWVESDFVFRGRGKTGTSTAVGGLEFGGLEDVLGTDPYYASSYVNQRYDDVLRGSDTQNAGGLLGMRDGSSQQPSNCALLSGSWKKGTRYQLTFNMTNPSGGGERASALAFWMAPVDAQLVTTRLSTDGTLQAQDTAYTVRGDKQGSMCSVRSQAESALGTFWDACSELAARDATQVTSTSTPSECITSLRTALAADATLASTFPFNQPPLLTTLTTDSFPQAVSACGAREALSPRFGGECVSCDPGLLGTATATNANPCTCPPGTTPLPIGPQVCSPRSVGYASAVNETGGVSLAAALCAEYSARQEGWKQRSVSDEVVARLYLKAFAASAAPIIDAAAIKSANATFFDTLVFDDRRPGSPTRRLGIKPSCKSCPGDSGEFKDVYSGDQVPLFDFHFEATHTFRFIGFLLDEVASSACPALWDRSNSKAWKYTHHVDTTCDALPDFSKL